MLTMSLTFREAKTQLSANSVAELREILEQVQRPTSEPISSEDFDLLRVIYPLVKQGMPAEQALNLYNEAPLNALPHTNQISNLRQELLANSVEDALRQDTKDFYLLYFGLWEEAMRSPEIINDSEVQIAYKKAMVSTLQVVNQTNANMSFLLNFKQRLRQKGFLPVVEQPAMLEAGIDTQEAA